MSNCSFQAVNSVPPPCWPWLLQSFLSQLLSPSFFHLCVSGPLRRLFQKTLRTPCLRTACRIHSKIGRQNSEGTRSTTSHQDGSACQNHRSVCIFRIVEAKDRKAPLVGTFFSRSLENCGCGAKQKPRILTTLKPKYSHLLVLFSISASTYVSKVHVSQAFLPKRHILSRVLWPRSVVSVTIDDCHQISISKQSWLLISKQHELCLMCYQHV